mmetsp:Transcript_21026/g.49978  ORF Transcript_21026/g.49978 Transcript_21026/m.49978 type:complete len:855 (+) Transcript_21026:227-2791(+)
MGPSSFTADSKPTTTGEFIDPENNVETGPTATATATATAPKAEEEQIVGTEDTPLTIQGQRRRSSTTTTNNNNNGHGDCRGRRRRRRSSRRSSASSRIISRIARAFSISGASEVSTYYDDLDNDDDDDDDDYYDVDNNSAEFGILPDGVPVSLLCCRRRRWVFIVSLTMAVGVLAVLITMVPSYNVLDRLHTGNNMDEDNNDVNVCRSDDDVVQSLKPSAYLDGMKSGAVASDNPICSKVGRDILMQDGNAVDAAVAAILCLGVANPASSGLGGGAFLLVRSSRTHFEQKDKTTFPDYIDERDGNFEMDRNSDWMVEVVDCRETAPGDAHEDMYSDETGVPDTASAIGGLAIATPGELRGLELAHARHGRLSWSEVVEPARRLAKDGFPVSRTLEFEINITMTLFDRFGDYPTLRSHLSRDGKIENGPLQEGDVFTNPRLAATLQQVSTKGADVLYRGKIAQMIAADVQNAGGILTAEDLEGYKPVLRSPLSAETDGFTVVGVPPPSSGGAALIGALRFLSGFKTPFAGAGSADTLSVHRMVEAMRHVFAIRMSLSDPTEVFGSTNITTAAVHDLLRGDYMESLRRLSRDNDTLPLSLYGGQKWAQLNDDDASNNAKDAHEGDRRKQRRRLAGRPFGYLEDSGTSHLSVIDKDGNSVAVTSSVNGIFGSWVFSEGTGVLLGNTMDDFGVPSKVNFFGLTPSKANFIKPGKRPLSSMSPTMVFRHQSETGETNPDELILTIGGSGGPKIITAVLQVLTNILLLGMGLFESMAKGRVHDQLVYHGAVVTATEKMSLMEDVTLEVTNRTKDALLRRGHNELFEIDYTGCVQAVFFDRETETLSAVSDIRKGGSPAGY